MKGHGIKLCIGLQDPDAWGNRDTTLNAALRRHAASGACTDGQGAGMPFRQIRSRLPLALDFALPQYGMNVRLMQPAAIRGHTMEKIPLTAAGYKKLDEELKHQIGRASCRERVFAVV